MDPRLYKTRKAVKIIATFGSGTIVSRAVDRYFPKEKKTDQVTLPVAGFVVGSMLGEAASNHVDTLFDEALRLYDIVFENK